MGALHLHWLQSIHQVLNEGAVTSRSPLTPITPDTPAPLLAAPRCSSLLLAAPRCSSLLLAAASSSDDGSLVQRNQTPLSLLIPSLRFPLRFFSFLTSFWLWKRSSCPVVRRLPALESRSDGPVIHHVTLTPRAQSKWSKDFLCGDIMLGLHGCKSCPYNMAGDGGAGGRRPPDSSHSVQESSLSMHLTWQQVLGAGRGEAEAEPQMTPVCLPRLSCSSAPFGLPQTSFLQTPGPLPR
ncbi:uncharacterized protein V6R79_010058 [Siganus canaliculatus]